MRLAKVLNTICKRFAQTRIADLEFGVCTNFLIMKSGDTLIYLLSSTKFLASILKPSLSEHLKTNPIFNELSNYYMQEFEDVAERFGSLMMVLESIAVIFKSLP
jgi:hypothetical protein